MGKLTRCLKKNIIFVFFDQRNGECASCPLYIVIVTDDDEIQTEFSRLAAREGKVQFQVVPNSYLHTSFELLRLVKNPKKFQPDQVH